MAMNFGPPERSKERKQIEAEDDTQAMIAHDDVADAWARKVASCEDQGLD